MSPPGTATPTGAPSPAPRDQASRGFHIERTVTISITWPSPRSSRRCPSSRRAATRPDGKGGYLITLSHGVVDRLKAMRGPGEG
jgi:hypothetical protein